MSKIPGWLKKGLRWAGMVLISAGKDKLIEKGEELIETQKAARTAGKPAKSKR